MIVTLLLSLAAYLSPASAPCSGSPSWQQLIIAHRARYPAMELVDAMKLLQQATRGSEHAVSDASEATTWMDREWAALDSGPPEPMVDTLGMGGTFARVQLRPYRAAGGTPVPLVAAFVETAQRFSRDTMPLACALGALAEMAARHVVPWSADSVRAMHRRWGAQHYPALDHSPAFERLYRPAYRVVALPLIPALLATLHADSPPATVLGEFVDDYDDHFTVTATDWFQQPRNHYTIVAWHPAEQYLIAQNSASNRSAPSRWTRIDWVAFADQGAYQWGFCFSAYDAATRAAAEAAHVVDRAHPRTGCNGYPFSRMRRSTGGN